MRINKTLNIFQIFEQKILKRIVKQPELVDIIRNWEYIIGNNLAEYCIPKSLKKDFLYIEVSSNTFLHSISYKKIEILSKLAKILGKKIKDIKITVVPKEIKFLAEEEVSPKPQENKSITIPNGIDGELKISLINFGKKIK